MGPVRITEEIANRIYTVLKEECGAHEEDRDHFVYAFAKRDRSPTEWRLDRSPTEWRFMGVLGFGGKFWQNAGRWYVTCYQEDETPKRVKALEMANARLECLKSEYENRSVITGEQ